mmetsp:Transcript_3904/g.12314  ORF Transcript_3904/g.12314 Transcript_3904/m.12314 type:complete len:214 (-) Transcript_3904:1536-2177(-)
MAPSSNEASFEVEIASSRSEEAVAPAGSVDGSQHPGVAVRYALLPRDEAEAVPADDALLHTRVGEPLTVLCGVANRANAQVRLESIEIEAVPLMFNDERLPYDLLPMALVSTMTFAPGEDITYAYDLRIPENRPQVRSQVSLTLHYSVDGKRYFEPSFFNRTIQFAPAKGAPDAPGGLALSVVLAIIAGFVGLHKMGLLSTQASLYGNKRRGR